MRRELDELMAEIRAQRGAEERIQAGVAAMRRELAIERLRQGEYLTQDDLARHLGDPEGAGRVPGLEVDTLRRYVEHLGGRLRITAVVDGESITVPIGSEDD